jgi:hypothetical protein
MFDMVELPALLAGMWDISEGDVRGQVGFDTKVAPALDVTEWSSAHVDTARTGNVSLTRRSDLLSFLASPVDMFAGAAGSPVTRPVKSRI